MQTSKLIESIALVESEVGEVYSVLLQERDVASLHHLKRLETLVDRLGTALDAIETAYKAIDEL